MKKLFSILFSTRLTSILFVVFAAAMAIGTFLDASSDTSPSPYTRELIYDAWWFEAIMLLFVINFIGNMKKYQLHKRKNWSTLLLHLSFILIIIGAFVTRYISYEGMMHIREGSTENTFLSSKTYLNTFIDGDYEVDGVAQRRTIKPKELVLSERLNNSFEINTDYNEQPVTISYVDYYYGAEEGLVVSEDGDQYLKIVEAGDGTRHEHWLKMGDVMDIHNMLFSLNNPTEGAINLMVSETGSFSISTPFEGNYMRMADQKEGEVFADSLQSFNLRSLYRMGGMAFVIPDSITKGKFGVIRATENKKNKQDALILDVTSKGVTKRVELLGGKGTSSSPTVVEVSGLKVSLSYGAEVITLPFSITLNDFVADRYPGTEFGYSAFKSKVTVNNTTTDYYDYDIYMNNILDNGGFRFFQASFDKDEKGTVLSVSHDLVGTWITYVGYTLLYLGLLAILFDKNSRFGFLKKGLKKLKKKKEALLFLILLSVSSFGIAQEFAEKPTLKTKAQIDSIIYSTITSKEHAANFGKLVLQDDGRMKPINTYSSELLRKISNQDHYEDLDANQVLLSMCNFPSVWFEAPIVYLKRGNDSIRKILGVPKETKRVSMLDLFDEKGNYKLAPYIEEIERKVNLNQFEKDFRNVHQHFYLLNQTLGGSIFKLFPVPKNDNNDWITALELNESSIKGQDSMFVRNFFPVYFELLRDANETKDYSKPDQLLVGLSKFQRTFGGDVMPSELKIKTEITYNKVDIFNRLYKYFLLIGVLMFFFIIFQIFKGGKSFNIPIKISKYIIWIFFILLTVGLITRWYISGHAPWSDAYESVVYVAWATVLFGLTLGRKSDLTVASTAFVAAIILWAAHLNWLDPSIANLQPVLDSYWLMIHVAIIVASYGPFTLGMILGVVSLLLMVFTTEDNKLRVGLNIKELTIITEMALTVGLVMLTIGNFLGGQWANESWGRYWGWDPKETWALISIMIYAFVIHMRLVPGLRGRWGFNVAATLAFSMIMMTYFGVNFYLGGLHSYASGDKPITPMFVFYSFAFVIILSFFAYLKNKKYYKK